MLGPAADDVLMMVAADNDLALVDGLRRGDESAFTALIERYQASLIRVLRGIDRFACRASLKTWLFQIAANRARTRAGRAGHTVAFSSFPATEAAVPASRFRPADAERPRYILTKSGIGYMFAV